jgi:diguanylate cyclase (GGDEF)-like protein
VVNRDTPTISASASAHRVGPAILSAAVCLIVASLSIALLIRLLADRTAVEVEWWLQALVAIVMMIAATYGFVHPQAHWIRPMRKAIALLPQVCAGQASIAELDAIGGGIEPLIAAMQEALRDLRRQRSEVARIELELTQRVANRTDALERTMAALKQQAARDALTGLYNRRMFDVHLPILHERCRAKGLPLSLLMIDVDDFKLLNDTLGHGAGDEFLRSFGQLVRSTLRSGDFAFRYGGDEFVIAVPGAVLEQAQPLRKRLESLVDGLAKPLRVPSPPRISVGLVCTTSLPADAPAEALVREADRLLYEAKQARKAVARPAAA